MAAGRGRERAGRAGASRSPARADRAAAAGAGGAPAAPRAWRHGATALVALAAAVVAAAVFRGALAYDFAQDDFAGLARARGLSPALEGPWRWISGQLYFDVMKGVAGAWPLPYHAVSLATHAAVSALVAWFLARRVGAAAALAGGAWFAAHPAHYTAVYSVSGIGELLAGGLAVAALVALGGAGRARWVAPAAFALALLCKESVVLLPLAALLAGFHAAPSSRDAPGVRRAPDAAFLAAVAVAVAGLAALAAADAFGVRGGLAADAAYSAGAGRHVLDNLLTYAGWTTHVASPLVHGFTDAVDPPAMPWGWALLAAWTLGAWSPALRARGWLAAGALWLLWLLPVLPLRNHTYHYYLYAPLVGSAWLVAALLDAALARRGARSGRAPAAPRPAPAGPPAAPPGATGLGFAFAAAVAALAAVNGAHLVHRNETAALGATGMRADPTVDRARVVANVRRSLGDAALPPGEALVFWMPRTFQPGLPAEVAADTSRDTYWETNVKSALMDGLGVRVLFPAVGGVRFARAFVPAPDAPAWAVTRVDGLVQVASQDSLAALLAARPDIR